jgi:hypothetical protein
MQGAPRHPWWSGEEAPLLKLNIPEEVSDEELEAAFAAYHAWLRDEVDEPYGVIVDVGRLVTATATQRKIVADYEKKNATCEARFSTGQALIVPNPVLRGMVTAIYWLSSPAYPHRFFATRFEGRAWALEDLERGLEAWPDGAYWAGRAKKTP